MDKLLTEAQIRAAEEVLQRGDRVEIIPVKEGVRVVRIQRKPIDQAGPAKKSGQYTKQAPWTGPEKG